jgi:hypothetical protein
MRQLVVIELRLIKHPIGKEEFRREDVEQELANRSGARYIARKVQGGGVLREPLFPVIGFVRVVGKQVREGNTRIHGNTSNLKKARVG